MQRFHYPATEIFNAHGERRVVHSNEEYFECLSSGWLAECPAEFAPVVEPAPVVAPEPPAPKQPQRVCGNCGQPGHNIRNCPLRGAK